MASEEITDDMIWRSAYKSAIKHNNDCNTLKKKVAYLNNTIAKRGQRKKVTSQDKDDIDRIKKYIGVYEEASKEMGCKK